MKIYTGDKIKITLLNAGCITEITRKNGDSGGREATSSLKNALETIANETDRYVDNITIEISKES